MQQTRVARVYVTIDILRVGVYNLLDSFTNAAGKILGATRVTEIRF